MTSALQIIAPLLQGEIPILVVTAQALELPNDIIAIAQENIGFILIISFCTQFINSVLNIVVFRKLYLHNKNIGSFVQVCSGSEHRKSVI
ncbi:hypothetical protein [Yersinia aldovae]|uniref:hypothetical protein n=1 Tax=Yersinia aldovae TaxID=29483 RepID=UPI0012E0B103|nr:hypothetical protein [Yersinia aldovae]